MKNEKSSKRVAAIAGRVLSELTSHDFKDNEWFCISGEYNFLQVDRLKKLTYPEDRMFTVADLKALAASCLTQAPDRQRKK